MKRSDIERWFLFLKEKIDSKKRGEHLDKLFVKDYRNAYKIFHKMIRQGR